MNDRDKAIIDRIKNSLREEGFVDKPVYMGIDGGLGDFEYFFEVMVDLRLRGIRNVTPEFIWEDMKMQINNMSSTIRKAGEDYTRLANKHRDLQNSYIELIKNQKGDAHE